MGDIHCANCGEPWDTYHLRWDAPWDLFDSKTLFPRGARALSDKAFENWNMRFKRLIDTGEIFTKFKKELKEVGWEFGGSCYTVLHCPCCKENGPLKDSQERKERAEVITDLLGDDIDGIQSMMEDLDA